MVQEYNTLLNTYKRMFGLVDIIHFNSQNTRDVFEIYLTIPDKSAVVTITHSGIEDHRKVMIFDDKVLKLGFVGSDTHYKGFPMLKRVIARINAEGLEDRIHLSVYGGRTGIDGEFKNVEYKGRFTSNQLKSVYDSMDLLIVPSICFETFSLTTIEGLQFGVPVLVSSKVGAKDVVKQYAPRFVFESEEDLFQILKCLVENRSELERYNKNVVNSQWQWSMKQHAKDLEKIIYRDHE